MENRLRKTQLRVNLFETCQQAGCVNPKAALALATEQGLTLGDTTQVDWLRLRQSAPELFRHSYAGSADGGAGMGQKPRVSVGDMMNRLIRDARGY